MTMTITPSFGSGNIRRAIGRTINDPTDVNNKEAAVGGLAAAGGVGGAAVVASKLKTASNLAKTGQAYAARVAAQNAKNLSILAKFAANISKFFKQSKATAWAARLMETPMAKKVGGAFGGALALGITGAQLYSAGDMALEAKRTYGK